MVGLACNRLVLSSVGFWRRDPVRINFSVFAVSNSQFIVARRAAHLIHRLVIRLIRLRSCEEKVLSACLKGPNALFHSVVFSQR